MLAKLNPPTATPIRNVLELGPEEVKTAAGSEHSITSPPQPSPENKVLHTQVSCIAVFYAEIQGSELF
jgi:hypothetical protein